MVTERWFAIADSSQLDSSREVEIS